MINGWHGYTEFLPSNSAFVPWIRTILDAVAFILLRVTSDVKQAVLPDNLPISVYLEKSYLMDVCRGCRDSIDHILIMINWKGSTNAST